MGPAIADPEVIVSLTGCSKEFAGREVLRSADLRLRRGEVHGLIGQNGSGKSTLVKILAGYHAPEPGAELVVDGDRIDFPLSEGAQGELGFSFVHQDLGLFDDASVLENVSLGTLRHGLGWRVSWRNERRRVAAALERFGVAVRPEALVGSLKPADKARVAIVRALEKLRDSGSARLLVLDEPTPHLSRDGIERLFETIREVARDGLAVLLVTHRMDEIVEITDTVTVLRDGRVVATIRTAEADEASLSEALLGFKLDALEAREALRRRGSPILVADRVSGETVHDVTLEAARGEVLGLTGIVGSGWEELPQLLFGVMPLQGGTIAVDGRRVDPTSYGPRRAIELGMSFVPGDRHRDGAVLAASVQENITLLALGAQFRGGRLDRRGEAALAASLMKEFDVRPPIGDMPLQSLSGGNQQKVVLAKWLHANPSVVLLHEPTQGVDVGARRYIYGRLREAAAGGTTVIIASAEYEDLSEVCDRVLVFKNGRVAGEFEGPRLTYERILTQAVAI